MKAYTLRGQWPVRQTATGPLAPPTSYHHGDTVEGLRELAKNWSLAGAKCVIYSLHVTVERWEGGERV